MKKRGIILLKAVAVAFLAGSLSAIIVRLIADVEADMIAALFSISWFVACRSAIDDAIEYGRKKCEGLTQHVYACCCSIWA